MAKEITERRFEGVEFVQKRIDHNETEYDSIAKQMAAKDGSGNFSNLLLDLQLAELVHLPAGRAGRLIRALYR